MSKVVAGKSPRGHYTQISNALIRNSEIDDGTFRLICWMTSHEEGFEVNFNTIQNFLCYGRDKLRNILKNAEAHNYLVRRKIRSEKGLFDFEYHIFKDTEDAIVFRKALPEEELTSDLFSGGGSSRGGLTGGGSTGGGSSRGGQSGPHKEKQYREEKKEEEKREENPLPPYAESSKIEKDFSQPKSVAVVPNLKQDPPPQILALLLTNSESLQQTDNPSSGQIVAASFDKPEQTNKPSKALQLGERSEPEVGEKGSLSRENAPFLLPQNELEQGLQSPTEHPLAQEPLVEDNSLFPSSSSGKVSDEDLSSWFLSVYNAEKPSNFTEHRQINVEHIKKIKHLVKDFPDTAIEMFADALVWVREQEDGWWRQKQFSLSNLMTNGKIVEYADKHATAMKYDAKYRARVEGRSPSMDKGRVGVVDEDGNESTGAMADIARLYATDPMFRMLMDAGK
jgi:hypothetical protein